MNKYIWWIIIAIFFTSDISKATIYQQLDNKIQLLLIEADDRFDLGYYTEAISLKIKALDLIRQHYSTDEFIFIKTLNDLGIIYMMNGQYSKADSVLKTSLELSKKSSENSSLEKGILINLGILKRNEGKYTEAKEYFEQALNILKKISLPDDPDVAACSNNLGQVYSLLGQYNKAKHFLKGSLAIMELNEHENYKYIIKILINLAEVYFLNGDMQEAGAYFSRAYNLLKDKKMMYSPDAIVWMENFANKIKTTSLSSLAENLLFDVLQYREQTLPKNHPKIATTLNNLGALYYSKNQFEKAEEYYKRAYEIQKVNIPSEHLDNAILFSNLSLTNAYSNRPLDAFDYQLKALNIFEKLKEKIFAIANETEKQMFIARINLEVDFLIQLILNEISDNNQTVITAFDEALKWKGVIIEALIGERKSIIESENPENIKILNRLKSLNSQLATLILANPNKIDDSNYKSYISKLSSEKDFVEAELAHLSKTYSIEKEKRNANHRSVAKLLPNGSALVEIVNHKTLNIKIVGAERKNWENYYAAFILPAGKASQPMLIDLGEADNIDGAIEALRQEISQSTENMGQVGAKKTEQNLVKKSNRLYQLVFAPLENAIGKAVVLYIAPDSDLNLIPFGILQDNNGQYLAEKYQFDYLSSGRDIIGFGKEDAKNQDVVIMAAPAYDLRSSHRLKQHQKPTEEAEQFALRGETNRRSTDLRNVYWNSLPNTKNEAEQIAKMFPSNNIQLYVGNKALEETFKQLKAPKILHIATHGFFLQDVDKSQLYEQQDRFRGFQLTDNGPFTGPVVNIENPLLRSGLVLAGANNLGKEELPEGVDDGILTAYEISGMNLWGTDLVVLSACETGVGETRRGEGVFGLRRAFQLAGAKTVVMSLWKVPDQETQELMVEFYRRMQAGEGKARALQNAQLAMIKDRRDKYGAAHPFYWGAFVCVGEP